MWRKDGRATVEGTRSLLELWLPLHMENRLSTKKEIIQVVYMYQDKGSCHPQQRIENTKNEMTLLQVHEAAGWSEWGWTELS